MLVTDGEPKSEQHALSRPRNPRHWQATRVRVRRPGRRLHNQATCPRRPFSWANQRALRAGSRAGEKSSVKIGGLSNFQVCCLTVVRAGVQINYNINWQRHNDQRRVRRRTSRMIFEGLPAACGGTSSYAAARRKRSQRPRQVHLCQFKIYVTVTDRASELVSGWIEIYWSR